MIVQTSKNVTLIGAGPVNKGLLSKALPLAPFVVAADGGVQFAQKCGVVPEFVIGDLDSADKGALERLHPDRIISVCDQETTDFEKSLARIVAPMVLAIGFLGGRADHQMAVLNVLGRSAGRPVLLLGDHDVVLAVNGKLTLDLEPATRVSIFPLKEARVDCKGLRWPLNDVEMSTTGLVSQSNEVDKGPLQLRSNGSVLVFLPAQAIGAAFAAFTRSRQTT